MTELEEGRLIRDCRWLCIRTEQCVSRRLAPMDITAVQAHILLFLLWHGEKGTLLTDIHRAFGYSMPTLSCMVKRLREKGYIRAEHCRGDDRRRLLFATETARLLQPELERSIGAVHRQLYDGFSRKSWTPWTACSRSCCGTCPHL